MHELSLGNSIQDYLTGEEIEETTYEEFRQALATLLVEERGWPKERLRPKVGLNFPVGEKAYTRTIDLVADGDDGKPLILVFFCAGQPGSFDREIAAAARLIDGGPAPLAVATDTKDAVLVESGEGQVLRRGMEALPYWDDVSAEASGVSSPPLSPKRAELERRILYTYSEYLTGCCGSVCPPAEAPADKKA